MISFLSLILGNAIGAVLAGVLSSLFLMSLNGVIQLHQSRPNFIFLLPILAVLLTWINRSFPKYKVLGVGVINGDIQRSTRLFSFFSSPLVFIATLLSHLAGASVGREGTALQLGAGCADGLAKLFQFDTPRRRMLLQSIVGAAFSAAIGTPWAGMIFSFELTKSYPFNFLKKNRSHYNHCEALSQHRLTSLFVSVQSSWIAYYVSILCKAPHGKFLKIQLPDFSFTFLASLVIAGIIFGLSSRLFSTLKNALEGVISKQLRNPYLLPLIGALILCLLLSPERLFSFRGLGLESIQTAFETRLSLWDPLLKTFYTALSLSVGFVGGDFTPLVFIGSTLGSALSAFLAVPTNILASLGFVSVFAGAARVPFTGALIAGEIFGWSLAPWALLCCLLSTLCSSPRGIYDAPEESTQN